METQSQTIVPENPMIGREDIQELDYWSNEFGVSKNELLEVVKKGGTPAEAVEKYVKKLTFAT